MALKPPPRFANLPAAILSDAQLPDALFRTLAQLHGLAYSGTQWQSRQTYYVQIYSELVSSGLLAKIPGNALKILLTLALNAGQLGVGSADQQHFFEALKQKNVFSEADRGQLFCYLDHDTICQQTGLSKNTVTAQTKVLADLGLVEKRVIKKGHGEGSYNLFFIRPAAYIDKNNALHSEKNAWTLALK